MAVPPRGDPRRPLHLAVSSCRLLGALGLILGTCAGGAMFAGAGGRGGPQRFIGAIAALAFYGGGGAMFLVFAHYMKRRRVWAVIAALAVTGLVSLLLLAGMIVMVVAVAARGVTNLISPIMLAVEVLILAALGQLIYHLARSFAAIRLAPTDEARGFDVLPAAVMPSESNDNSDAGSHGRA